MYWKNKDKLARFHGVVFALSFGSIAWHASYIGSRILSYKSGRMFVFHSLAFGKR